MDSNLMRGGRSYELRSQNAPMDEEPPPPPPPPPPARSQRSRTRGTRRARGRGANRGRGSAPVEAPAASPPQQAFIPTPFTHTEYTPGLGGASQGYVPAVSSPNPQSQHFSAPDWNVPSYSSAGTSRAPNYPTQPPPPFNLGSTQQSAPSLAPMGSAAPTSSNLPPINLPRRTDESYEGGAWPGGDDIDAEGEPDDEEPNAYDAYHEPNLSFHYGDGSDFQINTNLSTVGSEGGGPQPPLSDFPWHHLPQGSNNFNVTTRSEPTSGDFYPQQASLNTYAHELPLPDLRGGYQQPPPTQSYGLTRSHSLPQGNTSSGLQPSAVLAELERRLRGNVIRAVGTDHNTLADHRARRGPRSLPDPHSLVENTGNGGSMSHTSPSAASTSIGPIRTTNAKKVRRTASQLQASPSYRSRSSGRPEFTQADHETIENAIGLYLRDVCTKKPWPENEEKMALMIECLSQANIKSLGAGKPRVNLESEGYILRKRIGPAGSNFRGWVKAWLEAHVSECWDINPSPEALKTMTPDQENAYKQDKVNQLLASDRFASHGFWTIPARGDRGEVKIAYWYNDMGLHRAALGLFFDPTNKRYPIARQWPHVFRPLFPLEALSITSGIAKHVFLSYVDGRIVSKDMGDTTRRDVLTFWRHGKEKMLNPVYQHQIERELKQISDRGFQQLDAMPSETAPLTAANAEQNITLFDIFGDGPVDWSQITWDDAP